MFPYEFHPEALRDLDLIWSYIARDNLAAANRSLHRILDTIETTCRQPHIGSLRPDLTTRPLRFLHVSPWLIAYAPEKKPLWIVAVADGRRSPRVLAAILRERESNDSV